MKNKIKQKIQEQKNQSNSNINSLKEKEINNKDKERDIRDLKQTFEFYDKFPNENLFKDEYYLNEKLEFQNEEDKNRYLLLIISLIESNRISILIILYLRFFINISKILEGNNIYTYLAYFHFISILISSIILYKKSRLNNVKYRWIVKILFDFNQSLFIYFSIINKTEEISSINECFYNSIPTLILSIELKGSIYSILILSFGFLSGKYQNYSFSPKIYNLFFGIITTFIFVYLYKSYMKNLWILYDSFKRSFLINNNLMENNFSPIFIISRNMDILYYNDAARKFMEYIHKEKKNSDIKRKVDYKFNTNFQKMIIPSLYDLFIQLLKISVNNVEEESHFYFPFATINDNLINLEYKGFSNFYLLSGELLNLNWYNVICKNCIWKVHNCIFLNLIQSEHFLYNELFHNQIKVLVDKYEEFIENSNKMCEIIMRCERNSIIPFSHSKKSIKKLGRYIKKCDKLESSLSVGNENAFSIFPVMDFSILFFFKNQSEVLFDLLLTQYIYFSMICEKNEDEYNKKKEVNLEYFTNYFSFYFDGLTTSKNFTLEFKIKENCKYIIIEECLLRTTIFNIILFILSNSHRNNIKKGIVISIRFAKEKNYQTKSFNYDNNLNKNIFKLNSMNIIDFQNEKEHKELSNNGIFSLQFDISITGDSSLDYNKINTILQCKDIKDSFLKTEIEKQNLNIGILTAYYIVTKYYKKVFTMNSNEKGNIILFKLRCEKDPKKVKLDDFNDEEESFCYFKENFYFYNMYYHEKLIKNIYYFGYKNLNNSLNIDIENKNDSLSMEKSSEFDSEVEKSEKNINNNDNNKLLNLSMNNKSISKIKTELKNVDKDILSTNNKFDSFNIINNQNK